MGGASGYSDEEIMGESRTRQVCFDYQVEESFHNKTMSAPTHQFVVKFQWTSLTNDAAAAFDEMHSD
jgi:hypothetical protein